MSSPTRSALSSRASTPASDDDGPTIQSPRSRIQAMLAQIDDDDDSDDELMPASRSTGVVRASKPATAVIRAADKTRGKHASQPSEMKDQGLEQKHDEDEDEDEDEDVVRPKGRLAARMTAAAAPFQEDLDEEDSDEEDAGLVYQRVRRDLLAEKTKPAQSPESNRPRKEAASSPPAQPTAQSPSRARAPSQSTPSPPRRRLASRAQRLAAAQSPAASTRAESPGLFMSPDPARSDRPGASDNSDSEVDLPDSEGMRSRLRELVERRRREREEKEQQLEDAMDTELEPAQNALLSDLFDDDEDIDRAAEKKLTQQSRPTRKASKKALDDMSRETQRMSRNMQLTHLAKTKKKFTTADFLSSFGNKSKLAHVTNAADSSSVAAPESDAEARDKDTPPSSPPSICDEQDKATTGPVTDPSATDPLQTVNSDDELPDLEEKRSSQYQEKLKQRQPAAVPHSPKRVQQNRVTKKLSPRQYRIKPPPKPTQRGTAAASDSDSDLEIVQNADRVAAIFSSIEPSKATESRPLHVLRHLAHLHHSEKPRLKKGEKPSVTPAQLEIELRRRAKIQAITEREQKIASLKAKGIVIMTDEEREREQVVIENMLEKAREDANELRKKEKKAAKDAGEEASSDESEDGDYADSADETGAEVREQADEDEIELSGSEDEGEDEETDHLLDDQAGEDAAASDEEDAQANTDDVQDAMELDQQPEEPTQVPNLRRARHRKRIVEDDDDDDDDVFTPKTQQPDSSTCINDDLAAAFGFGPARDLSVSQMFAGTMADTQDSMDATIPGDTFPDTEQDSFDLMRNIPSAPLPTFAPAETQDSFVVTDSQEPRDESQGIDLQLDTQALLQHTPSLNRIASASQFGDLDFTPSQDVGLRDDQTPLKAKFGAPAATQETVLLDVPESPIAQQKARKGRLTRRTVPVASDDEDEDDDMSQQASLSRNAFEKMRKAAVRKATLPEFNKDNSDARRMVEEQAEESEDEYHGLGGASDDDALDNDVANEADKAMIDESEIVVNERELAALYAENARERDEAQTSKLYKDLMSGAMRRKRGGAGGAFDLDSDEDEQEAERRRRKQREEMRKRRLLLQDESVGKLGDNAKKEAFLRAIEDRDDADDDDMDVLDGHDTNQDNVEPADSQDIAQMDQSQQVGGVLAETSANPLKRKDSPPSSQDQASRKRPSRRNNPLEALRAPKSIQEVRESLSFLIDDAHALPDPNANGTIFSDNEDEDGATARQSAERAPASERRTAARTSVVDRLTLKKQASTSLSAAGAGAGGASEGNALAFAAPPSLRSIGSFSKAPSLLRRATTNLSESTSMPPPPARSGSGSGASFGGAADESGSVRMGGSKKSSINYQAREPERRVILDKAAAKRKEGVRRTAGLRGPGAVVGGLGGLRGLDAGSGFE